MKNTTPKQPFPYTDIINKSRPHHYRDDFASRHPAMPVLQRAKLFMPFDALRGFDAALEIAGSEAAERTFGS